MNFKRVIVVLFLTVLFWSKIFLFSSNILYANEDPADYVMNTTEKAINTLTDTSTNQKEKEIKFGQLFDKNFDVPSISRFVLGKYWKTSSTSQKKEFITAFRNYIVKTYSSRFGEYSGEKLTLLNTENEANPKLFIVHTALNREDGAPIKVDWRVGKKKDRFVILDIVIEGISLAVTQRSEFTAVIDQNDGNVDKLIQMLKEKST